MGGGDLNTKKSWHPSTLKNQERVWKAEQAAAEEKKRILELQREREQENDRTQLNEMAQRNFGAGSSHQQTADNRLHWMYDKPDKQVDHEDYLLGKEIGKSNESEKAQHAIPAVSRRVVGSSMSKSLDDSQVDLARKLREDPLLLVKERERAARAALLNNPLQRKRLAELLRKEKEEKESKGESKTKKKSKKKDKNLDDILAAKLNALGGEKGIDLSSLLNSNDSSSESSQSSDEKPKKSKKKKSTDKSKKKSKKSKKKKQSSGSESSDEDDSVQKNKKSADKSKANNQTYAQYYEPKQPHYGDTIKTDKAYDNHKSYRKKDEDDNNYRKNHDKSYDGKQTSTSRSYKDSSDSRKRRSDSYESGGESKQKRNKRDDRNNSKGRYKRRDSPQRLPKRYEGKESMNEAERAAKLAEMVNAGKERKAERGVRVARQRADDAAAEAFTRRAPRSMNNEARALPDSLESRIRSNRHYIQRDKMHMNQHFARR